MQMATFSQRQASGLNKRKYCIIRRKEAGSEMIRLFDAQTRIRKFYIEFFSRIVYDVEV